MVKFQKMTVKGKYNRAQSHTNLQSRNLKSDAKCKERVKSELQEK